MSETKNKGGSQIIVGAVVFLVLVAAMGLYVAGYFALGQYELLHAKAGLAYRVYGAEWQAHIFRPAAKIEGILTGGQVGVISEAAP